MKQALRTLGLFAALLIFQADVVEAQPDLKGVTSQAGSAPLRPGDGIRVRIYGDSVLNGEFIVDDRGIVVLPKIGEWDIAKLPADSVRPALVAALRVYLTNSSIEVVPFRRIAVVGAVVKPGLYAVDAGMSVADALILASGPTQDARNNVVELRAAGADSGRPAPLEARVWSLNPAAGEQLVVPPTSWIQRNGVKALTLFLSAASTASIIVWQLRR